MSRYASKLTSARIAPAGTPFANLHSQPYTCPELRPNTTRPGSMVAHALASRMGKTLRWPGGAQTDLHHNPTTPATSEAQA